MGDILYHRFDYKHVPFLLHSASCKQTVKSILIHIKNLKHTYEVSKINTIAHKRIIFLNAHGIYFYSDEIKCLVDFQLIINNKFCIIMHTYLIYLLHLYK